MKLNDFNNLANFGIEDPRMTTIGGVAFRHLDRLPKVGDQVTVEGITITILEMDAHRIERVRVSRGEGAEEAAIDQLGLEESGETATADSVPATGTEDSLSASHEPEAAPDDGSRQKLPAENGSSHGPAHAANEPEPGHDDNPSDRENKALH
jgi:hypothetical protein